MSLAALQAQAALTTDQLELLARPAAQVCQLAGPARSWRHRWLRRPSGMVCAFCQGDQAASG